MDWAGIKTESEKDQDSQAWHKWRSKGIGSSDAAVLLGWSPWKNIEELWEEKLGMRKQVFSQAQLSAMERGKKLEPEIREWYEISHCGGIPFKADTAEHVDHKFMRASFDGRNRGLDRVLEIKTANAKDHELTKNGEVPKKYQPQLQWLMMVGGHRFCDYVSYGPDGTYATISLHADSVMQDILRRRAVIFWDCIERKERPSERMFDEWERPCA